MMAMTTSRDAEVLRALAERIDPRDPGAFNNLGVLYFSKGMYAEAVDALLHAIALDPRMQTAMRNLEVAAAQAGACDAKLSALAKCVADDPDDRHAAREEARLLRLIGRHVDAAHKFDALIAEDPDDSRALFERGLLEQRAGDLRRAQRWFERATSADAHNTFARLQLAEVLYQRGQNEQSLSVLNVLLEVDATLADAHLLRGFVLGDMGQHEAGMESSRRAAALNPTLATVQPNLSLESSIESVVGLASDSDANHPVLRVIAGGEMVRYGLGLAFRQRGYFPEARQEFTRALAAGEDERLVRHALAELDLLTGVAPAAIASYNALLQRFGENARWYNELGAALHQRGQLVDAAAHYRMALRNDPRYALAFNNLGVALAGVGDGNAAREAFERAVSIDPTLVRARLNLARWHSDNQDAAGALPQLRELASFHADNVHVWSELAFALRALGRTAEADRALAKVETRASNAKTQASNCETPSRSAGDARALSIGIELQYECPDVAGAINLLAVPVVDVLEVNGNTPTAHDSRDDVFGGATRLSADIAANSIATDPSVVARVSDPCAEAHVFAASGQHANALERYRDIRCDTQWRGPRELWREAAIGEARSLCLLSRGAEALELIESVMHEPLDSPGETAELLALLAAAHAAAWAVADGDARFARAAIAQFLRVESRSAALLHFVGDVAMSIQEDALAVVLFRRALAVDPTRPTPRVAIARLLRRRNDVLAARLELVAALAVAPELREALLELAALHSDARRPYEALSILVAHLQRDPADVEALALLAHILLQSGRASEAKHALSRARRHDPSHRYSIALEEQLTAARAVSAI